MDIINIEKTIKTLENKKELSDVDKTFLESLKNKLTTKSVLK